jgi:hypothetical protein
MFKAYVGHSDDPDSQSAIEEVLQQCLNNLAGEIPQAGILFAASIDFDYALILAKIQETFPGIELIGGTANGEMSSVLGFQEDSITLTVICSDQIEISAGVGRGASKNIELAVQEAIAMATAKLSQPPQLCLTFPESIEVKGAEVIQALQQNLGLNFPILGATAIARDRNHKSHQFFHTEVNCDTVTILLFSGGIIYGHGVASGWEALGSKSQITKSDGCIIHEIDGEKAIEFYKNSLGNIATSSTEHGSYALAVFEEDLVNYYMRSPVAFDQDAGSIEFTADIPPGAIVSMAVASREHILQATELSVKQAVKNYTGESPAICFLLSCDDRRIILGTRAHQEIEMIQAHLPHDIACCGFYSDGEIAPSQAGGIAQLHNESFVTVLLGEI